MKRRNRFKPLIFAVVLLTVSATNVFSQTSHERTKTMTRSEITKETKADEGHSFDEYKAVVEALQPYIQNAKTGDGAKIRTAFYDHAHIVGSIGGELYNADLDAFGKSVSSGGPAPDVQHYIAWIDISGPAAAAKVEFSNWGGFRFTDFFVLYKHDGQWKISGKVYDSHSNN